MGRRFNPYYNYNDMFMWDDETWKDRHERLRALLDVANDLIGSYREKNPVPEYFADRHDEVRDSSNRCAYFTDVVADWKAKGMNFVCSGMLGLTMAPDSVVEHRKRDAKVLYIPDVNNTDDPHYAINLLEHYRSVLEECAKAEVMVSFLPIPMLLKAIPILEKFQETQGNYRLDFDHVYLYLDFLEKLGFTMDMVSNKDEYKPIEKLLGHDVVFISDKWEYHLAHQYIISRYYWETYPKWDYQQHIHTAVGRHMAESMRLEYDFDSSDDPILLAQWERKGLRYEKHFTDHELWITMTPKSVFDDPDEKIPLLCIFKEPRTSAPFMMNTAMQFYYQYIDLAAQGNFMILFFVLETPDDNDMLLDVLEDAKKLYPIDESRIYITGQSHNGYYALEFYRRHPLLLAAAATLADPIGLEVGATVQPYNDEQIESFAKQDMPLININGQLENKYYTAEPGSELEMKNAVLYRNRLKAFRCKDRSIEEIIAARKSEDYATRINGVPADRTEVRYIMGNEAYISDLQNIDGKWHLRFVTLENMPHMLAPQMADLAWEFMRRFARDKSTGEIKELF